MLQLMYPYIAYVKRRVYRMHIDNDVYRYVFGALEYRISLQNINKAEDSILEFGMRLRQLDKLSGEDQCSVWRNKTASTTSS